MSSRTVVYKDGNQNVTFEFSACFFFNSRVLYTSFVTRRFRMKIPYTAILRNDDTYIIPMEPCQYRINCKPWCMCVQWVSHLTYMYTVVADTRHPILSLRVKHTANVRIFVYRNANASDSRPTTTTRSLRPVRNRYRRVWGCTFLAL